MRVGVFLSFYFSASRPSRPPLFFFFSAPRFIWAATISQHLLWLLRRLSRKQLIVAPFSSLVFVFVFFFYFATASFIIHQFSTVFPSLCFSFSPYIYIYSIAPHRISFPAACLCECGRKSLLCFFFFLSLPPLLFFLRYSSSALPTRLCVFSFVCVCVCVCFFTFLYTLFVSPPPFFWPFIFFFFISFLIRFFFFSFKLKKKKRVWFFLSSSSSFFFFLKVVSLVSFSFFFFSFVSFFFSKIKKGTL